MSSYSKSLPVCDPSKGHWLLHYNPDRATFTGHTAAVADQSFGPFVLVLLLLVALGTFWAYCALPAAGIWPYMPLLFLFVLPLLAMDLLRPTHLEIKPQGFRIHWFHRLAYMASPWISWSWVRAVSYVQAEVEGVEKTMSFDLTIATDQLQGTEKTVFELLTMPVTSSFAANSVTLRLLECGFFQEQDQENFRAALNRYVSSEKIDASVVAREEFGEVPTYTALWLHSLHASKNAELNVLPEGTSLADGRYKEIRLLASGGQATVYEALCTSSAANAGVGGGGSGSDGGNGKVSTSQDRHDQPHALAIAEKCVLKEFVLPVRGGIEIKRRTLQNIQREASLLQSLAHPHIVKYRDIFVEGPRAYLVMEHIDGQTLRKVVEHEGRLPANAAVDLGVKMCRILDYLHSQRPPLIHRDFTPENLILTPDGAVTLIDFNVAQRLESKSTKTVVGKHAYIPPEQFRGKPTTQSDIYALGATLYFLLVGEDPVPLTTCDLTQAQSQHGCTVPSTLVYIIKKATALDPTDRFQSVKQMESALSSSGR